MAKKPKNITKKRVQAIEDKPFVPKIDFKPELDDDGWDADGLTIRQRSFAEALVGPAGGDASKAAEMAGYASENRNALKVTASRLLTQANVQEAIARELSKRRSSPEWAKNRLIDLARSSMRNFVSVDVNGEATLDFAKAASMGALDQLKEYREEGIKGRDGEVTVIKRTIKVFDPMSALQTLLKLHGLVNDAAGSTGTGDVPLEKHPAAGRVAAPSGTTPTDDEPGEVQDRASGPTVGKDGVGKAAAD